MITFTDKAIKRVESIINDVGILEESTNYSLRIFVEGGGCNGLNYGFSLEEKSEDDDTIIPVGTVTAVIDPASLQYLYGCSIDFKEDLTSSQFVINNPNATSKCGCGSSFAV